MANSSAHSARAGFNQSGGAYFVCVTPLTGSSGAGVTPVTTAVDLTLVANAGLTHLYKISTAAAKSGGAFEAATLAAVSAQEVFGVAAANADEAATEFAAGKLIKDMGKTIVDKEGRTFRKFAVAGVGANYVKSFGVAGAPATAPGAGYATFYLNVGREGVTGGALPAPIARYF